MKYLHLALTYLSMFWPMLISVGLNITINLWAANYYFGIAHTTYFVFMCVMGAIGMVVGFITVFCINFTENLWLTWSRRNQ